MPLLSADFTCSGCRVLGFLLPFGPLVCPVPLLWLLWSPARVCVSKPLGHPMPYPLVNAGLSDYKKKKKKKQILQIVCNEV